MDDDFSTDYATLKLTGGTGNRDVVLQAFAKALAGAAAESKPSTPAPRSSPLVAVVPWCLIGYPPNERLIEPTANVKADGKNNECHDADEGSASGEIV